MNNINHTKSGEKNMKIKTGEWIIIHPTDCFTLLPVWECSICEYVESGYTPKYCSRCGSINTIAKNKHVKRAICAAAGTMDTTKGD